VNKEVWKTCPSVDGLLVSSFGRVLLPPRNAPLPNGGYRLYQTKPRFGQVYTLPSGSLYYMVMVYDAEKRQVSRKVHQLVCEAFHGARPFPEAQVLHMDENGLNNQPDNLKWGTMKENHNMPVVRALYQARTGVNSSWAKHYAKLGEENAAASR
jgi:hypothetical protein